MGHYCNRISPSHKLHTGDIWASRLLAILDSLSDPTCVTLRWLDRMNPEEPGYSLSSIITAQSIPVRLSCVAKKRALLRHNLRWKQILPASDIIASRLDAG